MTIQSLKFLSTFALIILASATAACATETTGDDESPHLGTTTNGTMPIDGPAAPADEITLQPSKLPLLTHAPLIWEPVEGPNAPADRVVEVRPNQRTR